MAEDKLCVDLHNNGFKKHTGEWKAISEGVMNASKILTSTDGAYITDLLENIAEEMNLKTNMMDRDSWVKVFIETKDISGARNKKCFIRIFGVSLACSDPTTMFSHDIFDGNKLRATKTSRVWAAAYMLYGPAGSKTPWTSDITGPQQSYSSLVSKPTSQTPYLFRQPKCMTTNPTHYTT